MYNGGSALATANSQTHWGPPLHSQPHHGNTGATLLSWISGTNVCVKAVEGGGRRWGAAVDKLKTPWPFWPGFSPFPLQGQGDCVAQL